MMRDGDIRQPLNDWLRERYAHQPDTGIIHELKVPRPSARIDVALVNGELVGYEIKSDLDTLVRLPKQIWAMAQTCDRACVVAARKHVGAVMDIVPVWCGVLQPYRRKGHVRFKRVRDAMPVPANADPALAHLLNKQELLCLLEAHGLADGKRSKRRQQLVEFLLSNLDSTTLRHGIRTMLRSRPSCAPC